MVIIDHSPRGAAPESVSFKHVALKYELFLTIPASSEGNGGRVGSVP